MADKILTIPKPDKDGWFDASACKPPVGRFVESGAQNGAVITACAEVYFDGNDWICNGAKVPPPQFWRVKR